MTTTANNRTSASRKIVRVLIVDDHDIVRHGYSQLLGTDPNFEICGESANSSEAMRLVYETQPDLALIDITLQNGHGLELCKEIRVWSEQNNHDIKLLVVTAHDEDMYAERALHAGASGFLNKGETTKRLLEAIHHVMEGKIFLSQSMTERILSRLISGHYDENQSPLENLSDRELEVFELIGKGMTTREVAEHLDLSPKTVETYRENLKVKLNLGNANQLVCAAVHHLLESS